MSGDSAGLLLATEERAWCMVRLQLKLEVTAGASGRWATYLFTLAAAGASWLEGGRAEERDQMRVGQQPEDDILICLT
ncbi:hypothetical protein NDU88_001628 [Pleurodeles waltl]|uniref:Uncharacterized protein n=1 Tax=Pleurodeles waltl TaxID=8319 RepID=A0AAV7NBA7_PLEWA|nr:hypothetical protein NDU88_001628 [Pleurodeles waltl]